MKLVCLHHVHHSIQCFHAVKHPLFDRKLLSLLVLHCHRSLQRLVGSALFSSSCFVSFRAPWYSRTGSLELLRKMCLHSKCEHKSEMSFIYCFFLNPKVNKRNRAGKSYLIPEEWHQNFAFETTHTLCMYIYTLIYTHIYTHIYIYIYIRR